jgi:F1F0 ATPase subunit 2
MGTNETLAMMLAVAAGGAIGALFFGGLWWSVKKGVSASSPALWFSASLLLRVSLALTGFYWVSGAHWQRLLACLLGFFIARRSVTALTQASGARSARDSPKPPGAGGEPCA